MNKFAFLAMTFAAVVLCGCGHEEQTTGPTKGTLGLEKLSPEDQIKKVQNDPNIPEQYKQTYINSVKAKQGQGTPR